MKFCPKCGFEDSIYWRHSRYDFNADYCRREEFTEIEADLDMALGEYVPLIDEHYVYYRRGKGKIWVYRVAIEDFKVSTEKRRAYTKSKPSSKPNFGGYFK
jgi:hypothetical protein